MIDRIVKAVLGFVADYIGQWYSGEKAKEAEWAAKTREGQLRSVVDVDRLQVKIRNTEPIVPATPAEWNAGKVVSIVVLGFVLLSSSGCSLFTRYVYVADRKPIIELSGRPVVDTTSEFTPREEVLVRYAAELESKINLYNAWAWEQNRKNRYDQGSDSE